MVLLDNVRRSLELADIVLVPDVLGLADLPYSAVDAFAERGRQIPPQKGEAVDRIRAEQRRVARLSRYPSCANCRGRAGRPHSLTSTGSASRHAEETAWDLRRFAGHTLDTGALETRLTALTGDGRYDSATYEIQRRNDREGLLVRVHEKPYGPPFLKPGCEP